MKQPKQIISGDCRFYIHADGCVSAADDGGWVAAVFASLDAAKSWRGDFTAAELEFRRLNDGKDQGSALVPVKQ